MAGFWQNVAGYNYSTAWNNVKMAGMRIVIQHGASDTAGAGSSAGSSAGSVGSVAA